MITNEVYVEIVEEARHELAQDCRRGRVRGEHRAKSPGSRYVTQVQAQQIARDKLSPFEEYLWAREAAAHPA